MLSKKFLIAGNEAYIQSNKNPIGEVSLDWIVSSIHRTIDLVRINHDFITDVMRYDYILHQNEIINLNGFDSSDIDPNYSLIEGVEISSNRNQSEVAIPAASFQASNPLSPITAVSLFPINDAWKHHFKEFAQENIVDFTTGQFRQPFYFNLSKTDESGVGLNDGTIAINDEWGGDDNLEYSIDNGVIWNPLPLFENLSPAIYQVIIADGLGNESEIKEIEILAFVE